MSGVQLVGGTLTSSAGCRRWPLVLHILGVCVERGCGRGRVVGALLGPEGTGPVARVCARGWGCCLAGAVPGLIPLSGGPSRPAGEVWWGRVGVVAG